MPSVRITTTPRHPRSDTARHHLSAASPKSRSPHVLQNPPPRRAHHPAHPNRPQPRQGSPTRDPRPPTATGSPQCPASTR